MSIIARAAMALGLLLPLGVDPAGAEHPAAIQGRQYVAAGDWQRALGVWILAAQQGDATSQRLAADAIAAGHGGVNFDLRDALILYLLAGKQGDKLAQERANILMQDAGFQVLPFQQQPLITSGAPPQSAPPDPAMQDAAYQMGKLLGTLLGKGK